MSSPVPPAGEFSVRPVELAGAGAAVDVSSQDLTATHRRWASDAEPALGAAPEPTTDRLLQAAAQWFGTFLEGHARGLADVASALRGDQTQFEAVDRTGAGAIAEALNPQAPPR